jgi:hypothetical protein
MRFLFRSTVIAMDAVTKIPAKTMPMYSIGKTKYFDKPKVGVGSKVGEGEVFWDGDGEGVELGFVDPVWFGDGVAEEDAWGVGVGSWEG